MLEINPKLTYKGSNNLRTNTLVSTQIQINYCTIIGNLSVTIKKLHVLHLKR